MPDSAGDEASWSGARDGAPARRDDGARLTWTRDGADWPHASASRFVRADGLTFHVQVMGEGPVLLLVHGTGASVHSWRDLMPSLAKHFTVIAPDLPGHAFTDRPDPRRMSLPAMAASLGQLMNRLDARPQLVVGHSAGAAVLAEMCLDGAIAPAGLIALNGAFLPIGGLAGQVFSPLAKVFAAGSLIPRLFARWAGDRDAVKQMIAQTGSTLDRSGLALYARLMRDPAHTGGALAMMAHWELDPLVERLPDLSPPLLMIVGSGDRSVPPQDAYRVRRLVPGARVVTMRGLGHLAHEERPGEVVDLICRQAAAWGIIAPGEPTT